MRNKKSLYIEPLNNQLTTLLYRWLTDTYLENHSVLSINNLIKIRKL